MRDFSAKRTQAGLKRLCVFAFAFASVLATALATASSGARADGTHVLRVGLVQQPNSLDPLHAIEFYENYLGEALFSALVVIDDRGEASPDLVEQVPTRANGGISHDGKTLTYRLRKGVRWQDGVPLTSHDVAYTFARMMDPKSNFTETSVYDAIARIETPDDRTVLVRLKKPWPDAVTELFVGGQNGSIVPEHVLVHVPDLNGSTFESNPIGSGPYRLELWERGNRIVLRANGSYFRGKPPLDRIEIDFVPDTNTLGFRLRTGEIDFSPQLPQVSALQLRDGARFRFRAVPTYTSLQFDFNTTAAPFDDERVRQAFAMAIDRNRIAATSYHGLALPADDLVPPQSPFHVADRTIAFAGNPRRASELLDRAGWKLGPDALRHKAGATLAPALMIQAGSAAIGNAAVQVQAAWRAIGIDATIRPLQSNTMLAADGPFARGDYGVALTTYGYATSPDRSPVLRSDALAPNGRNYTRVNDPVLDRLVYDARDELDLKRRIALYAQISARVRHAAIYVPLLWLELPYVYSGRFSGLRPEPVNSDMWNAYDWNWK